MARLGEIPPTPLYKGGNIIYGHALKKVVIIRVVIANEGKQSLEIAASLRSSQ